MYPSNIYEAATAAKSRVFENETLACITTIRVYLSGQMPESIEDKALLAVISAGDIYLTNDSTGFHRPVIEFAMPETIRVMDFLVDILNGRPHPLSFTTDKNGNFDQSSPIEDMYEFSSLGFGDQVFKDQTGGWLDALLDVLFSYADCDRTAAASVRDEVLELCKILDAVLV